VTLVEKVTVVATVLGLGTLEVMIALGGTTDDAQAVVAVIT
jgi:hypothetical protein